MKESETKQMVILGGGFADISVARELGRLTKGDPSIQVHLVSNENYFFSTSSSQRGCVRNRAWGHEKNNEGRTTKTWGSTPTIS